MKVINALVGFCPSIVWDIPIALVKVPLLLLKFDFCNFKRALFSRQKRVSPQTSDCFISDSDVEIIRTFLLLYAERYLKFQCIYINHKDLGSYKCLAFMLQKVLKV